MEIECESDNTAIVRIDQYQDEFEDILKSLGEHTNRFLFSEIYENDSNDSGSEADDDDSLFEETLTISPLPPKNTLKDGKKEVRLMGDYGKYVIPFEESSVHIDYHFVGGPIGLMDRIGRYEEMYISCNSLESVKENVELLKRYILHTAEQVNPKKPDRIRTYISNEGCWRFLSSIPKRPADSVFHPRRKEVLDDLQNFCESEKDYNKHGIPYKRNYLFYGPPGTGKTSLMTSIASQFDANLYMINFSSKLTDASFMQLISKIPSGSVLVLEDIDALFTERVHNDATNHSMVSFSAVLNCLDGIARKNKMVSVMTTNFKDRLDSALIRPGRIDMVVEFDLATEKQIREMYDSYFGKLSTQEERDRVFRLITKSLGSKKISTAALQKFCFENRKSLEQLQSNLKMLNTLADQYRKAYEHLYM